MPLLYQSFTQVHLRAELIVALVLTIVIGLGSALAWPPFSTVMDWGESLKSMWESNSTTSIIREDETANTLRSDPSAGWGRFTVAEICKQQGIPIADGLAHLADHGIAADSSESAPWRTTAAMPPRQWWTSSSGQAQKHATDTPLPAMSDGRTAVIGDKANPQSRQVHLPPTDLSERATSQMMSSRVRVGVQPTNRRMRAMSGTRLVISSKPAA